MKNSDKEYSEAFKKALETCNVRSMATWLKLMDEGCKVDKIIVSTPSGGRIEIQRAKKSKARKPYEKQNGANDKT